MKLVKAIAWHSGECEAGHKAPEPSVVQVGVKGIEFKLCATHAAQLIKELADELGIWASDCVRSEVSAHAGNPLSYWPPESSS